MTWRCTLILASLATLVAGHGRVLDPVSRASAWRKGFSTPQNYDDDGLNCGGMAQQWSSNGGRCGICGDAYDLPTPRPHELGGKYGEGVIVAAFNPGSIISAAVQLTASHRGFWEFKICPDPEINDQGCFNKYPLELEEGGTKYYPTQGARTYRVNYRLPQGLKCEHCVLQWRYTAGNNWGVCPNGTQGLGCGDQEQFGACSDITIGNGANDFYNTISMEEENEVDSEVKGRPPQKPTHQNPQNYPTAPQKPHYIPVAPIKPPQPTQSHNQIPTQNKNKSPTGPQVFPTGYQRPTGPQQRPTGPQHKPTGPQQRPTGPQHKPTGPQQRPTGPQLKPTGPQQRPTGPQLKPTGPQQRPTGPQHKPTGPQQRPTGPQLKPTGPQQRPTGPQLKPTGPQQRPTGPQHKPTGPQQRPTGPQLKPTGPQQRPTGPQLKPTGTKRPTGPGRPAQPSQSVSRPPHPPRKTKPLPPGLREFLRQNSATASANRFLKSKTSKKQRINSKKPKTKIPTYLSGAIKLYPAIKTYYQKYPELFNPYFYG